MTIELTGTGYTLYIILFIPDIVWLEGAGSDGPADQLLSLPTAGPVPDGQSLN